MPEPQPIPRQDDDSAHLQLIATGLRRYGADPSTRQSAARIMLSSALALYRRQAGDKAAALACLGQFEEGDP